MEYLPQTPTPAPAPPSHSFVDRVVGSVKLSRPIFDEVRRDPTAMMQAAGIVAVTGLLSGISQFADVRGQTFEIDDRTYEVTTSVFGPLASGIAIAIVGLLSWVLASLLFRFVGTKLLGSPETNIQWQEVARPLGFASAPSLLIILTPIPVLGFIVGSIVGIWAFAAQIVAMSETFRVSKLRSFAIIMVAWIGLAIILSLILCICILIAVSVF